MNLKALERQVKKVNTAIAKAKKDDVYGVEVDSTWEENYEFLPVKMSTKVIIFQYKEVYKNFKLMKDRFYITEDNLDDIKWNLRWVIRCLKKGYKSEGMTLKESANTSNLKLSNLLSEAKSAPAKLYVTNHLSTSARHFPKNETYVHYMFNSKAIFYAKKPSIKNVEDESQILELDTKKAIKAGAIITPGHESGLWDVTFPDVRESGGSSYVKNANKFFSKIYINMSSYTLGAPMENDKDFYKKYGKSKIALEFVYPSDFKKFYNWSLETPT